MRIRASSGLAGSLTLLTLGCSSGGLNPILAQRLLPHQEHYFPRLARSEALSQIIVSSNVDYSFEACAAIDDDYTRDATRLYLDDLHPELAASLRPNADRGCGERGCYLRVVTAHLGRSLSLGLQIACETTADAGVEYCSLKQNATNAMQAKREHFDNPDGVMTGYVIVADRIALQGDLEIEDLSLVLIAREAIELSDGSSITTTPPVFETSHGRDGVVTDNFIRPSDPVDGTDGYPPVLDSGALVLVTPKIEGAGTFTTTGAAGGDGGDGGRGKVDCRNQCAQGWVWHGGRAGNGGPGGKGGDIWVFADTISSGTRFEREGGAGGAAGAPTLISGTASSGQGHPGQTGRRGELRFRQGSDFGAIAYLFAGQAAHANLVNARHYFGLPWRLYADPENIHEGDLTTRDLAAALFRDNTNYFCPAVQVTRPSDVELVGAPKVAALVDLCTENRVRAEWLEQGLNAIGLNANFYMYTPPHQVREMHRLVFDRASHYFDQSDGVFWSAVRSAAAEDVYLRRQQDELLMQLDGQSYAIADRAARVEIEAEKIAIVEDVVQVERKNIKKMLDELLALRPQIESAARRVTEGIVTDCGTLCWSERIFNLVYAVGQIGVGIYTAFSSGVGAPPDANRALAAMSAGAVSGAVIGAQGPGKPDDSNWLIDAYEYAKQLYDDGLSTAGEGAAKIGGAITQVQSRPPDPDASKVELLQHGLREVRDQIQLALEENYKFEEQIRETTEPLVDRAGALAALRTIEDLYKRARDLNDSLLRANASFAQAIAEARTTKLDYDLARAQLSNARRYHDRLRCRLGTHDPEVCEGIPPLTSHEGKWNALRDGACEQVRLVNERLLLMDFLFYRSLAFVHLEPPASHLAGYERADDFSRNLLVPAHYAASVTPTYASHEFIQTLAANVQQYRVAGGAVCRMGSSCDAGPDSDPAKQHKRAYDHTVVESLLQFGRTDFDLSPTCDGRVGAICDGSRDHSANRKRVTLFDIRPLTASGYTLPSRSWAMRYAHGDVATFHFGTEPTWRDFLFSSQYPVHVCKEVQRLAQAGTTLSFDCTTLAHFRGSMSYYGDTTDGYTLAQPDAQDASRNVNLAMFGTSIDGRWTLDIQEMLTQLSASDGCYTSPIPVACYPDACRSPCFDANGTRLPADQAPAVCACFDAQGARVTPTPASCQSAPAQLEPLRPLAERPPVCGPPTAATGVLVDNQLEAVCADWFQPSGGLKIVSQGGCCSADGTVRKDLVQCDGFTSDQCRVPNECLEICGPSCREFKANFEGFEYRILWTSDEL